MDKVRVTTTPLDLTPPPVKVIELQAQHGKFELVLDNPNAKRLTIFMLGDRKRAFIPPSKWFQDFRQMLTEALTSPENRVMVTHPMVSVLQVDLPAGPVVVTSPFPGGKDVEMDTIPMTDGGTYRVGLDDGCFVVSSGAEIAAPKVWLSRAVIRWMAERVGQLTCKRCGGRKFLDVTPESQHLVVDDKRPACPDCAS
jgi:hypothetical protein